MVPAHGRLPSAHPPRRWAPTLLSQVPPGAWPRRLRLHRGETIRRATRYVMSKGHSASSEKPTQTVTQPRNRCAVSSYFLLF